MSLCLDTTRPDDIMSVNDSGIKCGTFENPNVMLLDSVGEITDYHHPTVVNEHDLLSAGPPSVYDGAMADDDGLDLKDDQTPAVIGGVTKYQCVRRRHAHHFDLVANINESPPMDLSSQDSISIGMRIYY